MFQGQIGGNQGAATFSGLNNQDAQADTAHNPVTAGEVFCPGSGAQGILTDYSPLVENIAGQTGILTGINYIKAAGKYGNTSTAGRQSAAMGDGVNSFGHTADDGNPVAGQVAGDFLGYLPAVDRSAAGTHHCQAPLILREQGAPDIKYRRVIIYLLESGGVLLVVAGQRFYPVAVELCHLFIQGDSGAPVFNCLNRVSVQASPL